MFPFDDDPHTACIVCRHVLNKEEAITYITHNEDGMWQFLCDKEHSMDDARIVSLEEVYALDPSIGEVADMPCGCFFIFKLLFCKWVVSSNLLQAML